MKCYKDPTLAKHMCINCQDMFEDLQEYFAHKLQTYDRHMCMGCKSIIAGLENYGNHLEFHCEKRHRMQYQIHNASQAFTEAMHMHCGQAIVEEVIDDGNIVIFPEAAAEDVITVYTNGVGKIHRTETEHATEAIAEKDGTPSAEVLQVSIESTGVVKDLVHDVHVGKDEMSACIKRKENTSLINLPDVEVMESEAVLLGDQLKEQQTKLKKHLDKLREKSRWVQHLERGAVIQVLVEATDEVDVNDEGTMREKEHEKEHSDAGNIGIFCHVCKKTVHCCQSNLKRHLLTLDHLHAIDKCHGEKLLDINVQQLLLSRMKYQCKLCRFYCNEKVDFLAHISCTEHEGKVGELGCLIRCDVCDCQCSDNSGLVSHIVSPEHDDTMANKRKPCVIDKAQQEEEEEGQLDGEIRISVSKEYLCPVCNWTGTSEAFLQAHVQEKHYDVIKLKFMNRQNEILVPAMQRCRQQNKEKMRQCKFCFYKHEKMKVMRMHCLEEHYDQMARCTPCGLAFMTERQLSNHLKSANHRKLNDGSGKRYVCRECGVQSSNEKLKIFHELGHTNFLTENAALKVDPYYGIPQRFYSFMDSIRGLNHKLDRATCPDCLKDMTVGAMFGHLRNHDGLRPFRCPMCTSSFAMATNLRSHLKYHLGIGNCRCDKCGRVYVRKRTLDIHMIKEHTTGDKSAFMKHVCKYCGRKYFFDSQLARHEAQHCTGNVARRYVCRLNRCGMMFTNQKDLDIHREQHWRQYQCSYCSWGGRTKYSLHKHMQLHSYKSKVVSCGSCSYQTTKKVNLYHHIRTNHSRARPYQCSYCGFENWTFNNVKKHIHSNHRGRHVLPCAHCKYSTDDGEAFREHCSVVHGQYIGKNCKLTDYTRKMGKPRCTTPQVADTCETSLSGTRLYLCPYCKHGNPTLNNIKKHIRSKHRGLCVFPCPRCPFGTDKAEQFKEHSLSMHDINIANNTRLTRYTGIYNGPVSDQDATGRMDDAQAAPLCVQAEDPAALPTPNSMPTQKGTGLVEESSSGLLASTCTGDTFTFLPETDANEANAQTVSMTVEVPMVCIEEESASDSMTRTSNTHLIQINNHEGEVVQMMLVDDQCGLSEAELSRAVASMLDK